MSLTIRRATLDDVPAVSKMVQSSLLASQTGYFTDSEVKDFLDWYNEEAVTEYISERFFFVGELDGRVVCSVCIKEEKHYMTSLYMYPEYKGKGLGRKMVEFIEGFARKKGWDYIKLSATLVAEDFYYHLGYKKIGEYLMGSKLTFVEMEKKL
jgi:GNAT superfamily N-acetyltransferase